MCPVARICSKFPLTPNWHELIDSVVRVRNSSHMIWVCYITTKKRKVESSLIYRSRASQLRCKAGNSNSNCFLSSELVGSCTNQINQIKFNQMQVFEERGKLEYRGKNLSELRREPTNSSHIWHQVWKSNLGHFGGRGVFSPLRHHCWLSEGCKTLFASASKQITPWQTKA